MTARPTTACKYSEPRCVSEFGGSSMKKPEYRDAPASLHHDHDREDPAGPAHNGLCWQMPHSKRGTDGQSRPQGPTPVPRLHTERHGLEGGDPAASPPPIAREKNGVKHTNPLARTGPEQRNPLRQAPASAGPQRHRQRHRPLPPRPSRRESLTQTCGAGPGAQTSLLPAAPQRWRPGRSRLRDCPGRPAALPGAPSPVRPTAVPTTTALSWAAAIRPTAHAPDTAAAGRHEPRSASGGGRARPYHWGGGETAEPQRGTLVPSRGEPCLLGGFPRVTEGSSPPLKSS